jgi:hypothetical protein
MHRPAGLFVFVATLALLVEPGAQSFPGLPEDHVRREELRLRSHFDSVLLELRGRDVSHLSMRQQAARRELVTWLAEYRDAGRFPLNDRYADFATPIFRDARGSTCAMAYLVERSGRRDIVNRIAAARNLAHVAELKGDTALVAWLDDVGLDVAEAARIQPAYPGRNDDSNYAATAFTVALGTMSVATTISNVFRPSEVLGFVGIAVGGATVFIGTQMGQDQRALANINLVTGGLAVVSGIYAAFRPRPSAPSKFDPSKTRSVQWAPLTDLVPRAGQTRIGLVARF